MRILLDTNVLIAALISRGTCHELLELIVINHDVITSEFILTELSDNLITKFKFSSETAERAITLLRSQLQIASAADLPLPVSRDPDDDNVLAAALSGRCECIITGDKDLLVLDPFNNIRIVTPRMFLDMSV